MNRRPFSAAALFLCVGAALFAQSAGTQAAPAPAPAALAPTIAALEKKIAAPPGASPLSPAEKHAALRELARLRELSGDREGAARAWNEAAIALPGRDYDAFVRCAAALAATGEFDAAARAAQMGLLSPDAAVRARALVTGGQIEAFQSGNTASLRALVSEAAFAPHRPAIYYTIWKVSGDEEARAKLLGAYPQSPEALLAKDGGAVAASTPLWLLAAAPRPAPAPAPAEAVLLQIGAFELEANALALAARLRRAGFVPVTGAKTVNGAKRWTVGVIPGPDYNRTILLLKDAGFEAFPVYLPGAPR